MALWTPVGGTTPLFGAERGEVWARGAGSYVLSCTPRPASTIQRRQFQAWTSAGPWEQRWQQLTNAERAAWDAYAAQHLLYRLTGRPQSVSGQTHFQTYWRQVTLFDGSDPAPPWTPPSPPSWLAGHQPFQPFTDQSNGMAFVCRTERATSINFFLAAQPPLLGRQRLTRATLQPLGTLTLPAGSPGQLWTDPANAAAAIFGATALAAGFQQWWMAWELSNGAPLAVLDPCNTPPLPPAPTPDPCWDVLPSVVLATGAGGVPSGNFIWDEPVYCWKTSVGGQTRFIGSRSGVVSYTDGGGFLGSVAIEIQRAGTSPNSVWTFTQTQTTPFDGIQSGGGTIGTAEACAAPTALGVEMTGPSMFGQTSFE